MKRWKTKKRPQASPPLDVQKSANSSSNVDEQPKTSFWKRKNLPRRKSVYSATSVDVLISAALPSSESVGEKSCWRKFLDFFRNLRKKKEPDEDQTPFPFDPKRASKTSIPTFVPAPLERKIWIIQRKREPRSAEYVFPSEMIRAPQAENPCLPSAPGHYATELHVSQPRDTKVWIMARMASTRETPQYSKETLDYLRSQGAIVLS